MPPENNSKNTIAMVGFATFAAGLIGFITMPLFDGAGSLVDFDDSLLGPVFVYLIVVVACAGFGFRSPFFGGFAAGIAVPVTIAMAIVTVLGIVLTQVWVGGGGVDWGPGAFMAFVVMGGGIVAIATAQGAWRGSAAESHPAVTVLGSIASFATIAGLFAPEDDPFTGRSTTYADTLGFSTHAGVGFGVLFFAAVLMAVPILGFLRGKWGAGLLTGYIGYIALSFAISRADDPGEFSSLGGIDEGQEFHPAAAIGFWSMAVLAVIHTVMVFSTPSSSAAAPAPRPTPGSAPANDLVPAVWAADPFARHEHRFFDGKRWTRNVSDAGVVSRDEPGFAPPISEAADWYPDPTSRAEHRFYDGRRWTNQVSTSGTQHLDPPVASPPPPDSDPSGPAVDSMTPAGQLSSDRSPQVAVADEAVWDKTVSRAQLRAPAPIRGGSQGPRLTDRKGDELDLSTPVIIGRDPIEHQAVAGARLLPCADRTVSKTHVAFGRDASGVWVMDLHSRNGVTIAADPPLAVTPMTRHHLDAGDVIVIGDVTTYTVES